MPLLSSQALISEMAYGAPWFFSGNKKPTHS